ncbi:MAG: type II toxin-antitoxin system VapC family toxin [Acidobacteria bacterium]|nr:type II toxin-antitoxin system VapC family toxin [Acidobacteriota bacterium]
MLDTDTVSCALRGEGDVGLRLVRHKPSTVCISSITLSELAFGAARRGSPKLSRLIEEFAASVQVLGFDGAAAWQFGEVAADLARAGSPIGDFDALIAAHALSRDLILVTNNVKHFGLVPRLRTENWL